MVRGRGLCPRWPTSVHAPTDTVWPLPGPSGLWGRPLWEWSSGGRCCVPHRQAGRWRGLSFDRPRGHPRLPACHGSFFTLARAAMGFRRTTIFCQKAALGYCLSFNRDPLLYRVWWHRLCVPSATDLWGARQSRRAPAACRAVPFTQQTLQEYLPPLRQRGLPPLHSSHCQVL